MDEYADEHPPQQKLLEQSLERDVQATDSGAGRKSPFPFAVLLCSIGVVLFASGQAVSFKKLGYDLGPYPYFILLFVSFSFIPIFFVVMLYHSRKHGIVGDQKSAKFIKFYCIVGSMRSLNGILYLFSNPHVSGVMQQIFLQVAVPLTMVISKFYLHTKFKWMHYLGAGIVMVGVVIGLIPILEDHSSTTATGGVFWNLMFLLAQVPLAMAGIYQEEQFSKTNVDIPLMMFWSAVSEFLTLLVFAPVSFIPRFGNLGPSDFFANLRDGWLCMVNDLRTSEGALVESCNGGWEMILCAIVTMLLTYVFQTALVKYGSAALSVIVQTLVTPVSAIAFTFHFLMGQYTEKMNGFSWGSLAVLMIGIVVYRAMDLRDGSSGSSEEERTLLSSGNGSENDDSGHRISLEYEKSTAALTRESYHELSPM